MSASIFSNLPGHLAERTRLYSGSGTPTGRWVVYWMRTAVRSGENPALDVARYLAHQRELPLLVYQAISEHYRYASDRHHTFMLEGARDVQARLAVAGISYAFHLGTAADRRPHLATLARQATLLVTEDMPVDPPRRFLKALARQVDKPIICVDTACVAPMQLVKKPYTRAFQFRQATRDLYSKRLSRTWPGVEVPVRTVEVADLPFEPLDLQSADIPSLVANCEIDHAIGPVPDTPGGTAAGYARWEAFRASGLAGYARHRNNALRDGVSRLSPYLHYGMVSPMRIAREAAGAGNHGSEKYLDELLIWRELAYAFCFCRDDHDQWSALPEWARQTLEAHAADSRPRQFSWESMARGQTGDRLWDAAQRSLLRHGELHNNVRMTWGKAIVNWTPDPRTAWRRMIDLNHRYALDGRDPASYGGLLWCLGQFDRPFEPERTVLGTVRPRSTATHARRLDPDRYLAKIMTPRFESVPTIAVIGAGISGLFAARTLADHGLHVTVFEKSRGVGGRMATRRVDGGAAFDHGAQYFTARDRRFQRYVESWRQQGLVARWPDPSTDPDQTLVVLRQGRVVSRSDSVDRFVAVPGMNGICKHLADPLQILTRTRISKIGGIGTQLELVDETGVSQGRFDRLIVSAPAEQTAELLAGYPELADPVGKIRMQPCWATMASFAHPLTDQWAGAFAQDSFLSWVARNNSKPGRSGGAEHLVIHADASWSFDHRERPPDEVAGAMLEEFWRLSGLPAQTPFHRQSHRWKFALPEQPGDAGCFFDARAGIAACGDWACGSRVEGAFLSGMAAAGRILGTLTARTQPPPSEQMQLF